ncbi:tRNA wybutosine-synthesizing protein 3 [Trypanosoma conorhini]|uniref:tRNA(Phe) 7-[(3-amino-3-carboxypropyl)-4-demethylwyosine(37)-N(4)]-methyltransferase n=1 Tax=Trypanosoma conorhini TaxID=83891 RepID=A0A422PRG0_9TRYP|nr:tRNA wybutosine-synthesizing protein 3 [Trypanosoma conorhini]RNF20346.1 tRNA wybutosine-synthesizing protein 3 [Trypanosoma conorhini]
MGDNETPATPAWQERRRPHAAKRQQCEKEFAAHKRQVMMNLSSNACDHSPKGGVDRKCLPLMQLLNTDDDYVTTSSCSGRIALFHSVAVPEDRAGAEPAAVKRGDKDALGWLLVKHDTLTGREIELLVHALCDGAEAGAGAAPAEAQDEEGRQQAGELGGVWVREGVLRPAALPAFGMVALKMEPFVMHVECRTMEGAKRLLSAAAADAGFRNSGVTPPGKKIMCGIRHAPGLGLDVPLVMDGVNYVTGQHAYVRRLLQVANTKMQGNDVRLRRLEAAVAARLAERGEREL